MEKKYPHIFSPITIGGVVFRNRIWNAPAGVHLLSDKSEIPCDDVIAYYANKARGGAAVVTVSSQNMDLNMPYDPVHAHENVINPENAKMWQRLTTAVHYYGAKASLELLTFAYHGYDFNGKLHSYSINGDPGMDGQPTVKMSRREFEAIAENYADAAEGALRCGFDMVLIHGGHGLPLSSILSPKFNKRDDEFGGSLENRARWPMMVIDAIRRRVGRKLLIEYRVSGSELGGDEFFTEKDCVEFLKLIQDKIDIAHVSAGSFGTGTGHITHPTIFSEHGCNAYLAKYVKESGEIHIPVLTLGGFQEPELVEKTLAEGGADIVAMARGLLCDPEMPAKSAEGREDEIVPCIRCFHCLDYQRGPTFCCSCNPVIGRENQLSHLAAPVGAPKKVVIIGGGPAGMQAAITAAQRGNAVTLYEKAATLGGKLNFSRQVAFKSDLFRFMSYQEHMVEKLGVKVLLNTEATPELIAAENADVVLSAVGADPFVPPIAGVNGANVMTAEVCYAKTDAGEDIGENIVMLGGGEVGCETALFLAMEKGKKVTIIEMLPEICPETMHLTRVAMMERVDKYLTVITSARCTEVNEKGLKYEKDGEVVQLDADTVVLSAGMRPRQALAESFRATAPAFETIGDCVKASNVRNAVHTAYNAVTRF